jgi:hypothetical protein
MISQCKVPWYAQCIELKENQSLSVLLLPSSLISLFSPEVHGEAFFETSSSRKNSDAPRISSSGEDQLIPQQR